MMNSLCCGRLGNGVNELLVRKILQFDKKFCVCSKKLTLPNKVKIKNYLINLINSLQQLCEYCIFDIFIPEKLLLQIQQKKKIKKKLSIYDINDEKVLICSRTVLNMINTLCSAQILNYFLYFLYVVNASSQKILLHSQNLNFE